jgi:hypothetical protein
MQESIEAISDEMESESPSINSASPSVQLSQSSSVFTMTELTQALNGGSYTTITCAATFFILMLVAQSLTLVAVIA